MRKQLTHAAAAEMPGNDVVADIIKGAQIVEATAPFIKLLFDKIAEAIASIAGPNSASGRLKRIQALEAQNLVQKEKNKLYDAKLGIE